MNTDRQNHVQAERPLQSVAQKPEEINSLVSKDRRFNMLLNSSNRYANYNIIANKAFPSTTKVAQNADRPIDALSNYNTQRGLRQSLGDLRTRGLYDSNPVSMNNSYLNEEDNTRRGIPRYIRASVTTTHLINRNKSVHDLHSEKSSNP